MRHLEFEKPVLELESKIAELRNISGTGNVNIAEEIARMQTKADRLLQQTYAKLEPEQKVQVARHPERPHFTDYIQGLFEDYTPLSGDRNYADDRALLGGIARFRGLSCVVMGHEKGRDTESRIRHNFGMPRPEGYRKAQRLMDLAEKTRIPIISFIDTAGAYPGIDAEQRGQSEAIARSIEKGLSVKVPFLTVIIGEGGSGGAIAIATADAVFMLEHSIYSVISPEGCASILWRSGDNSIDAASALKLTAPDLKQLNVIDGIIDEPLGGAHRNRYETVLRVGETLEKNLKKLVPWNEKRIIKDRRNKFLKIGQK